MSFARIHSITGWTFREIADHTPAQLRALCEGGKDAGSSIAARRDGPGWFDVPESPHERERLYRGWMSMG